MRVIRPILWLVLGAALGVAGLLFVRGRGADGAPTTQAVGTAAPGADRAAAPARVVPTVGGAADAPAGGSGDGDAGAAETSGAAGRASAPATGFGAGTSTGAVSAEGAPALPVATSAEAEVAPLRTAELAFPVSGIVAERLVEVGDDVQAGDPLLRLDSADAQARLGEAQAAVTAADAQIAVAQAAQAAAERQVEVAQAAVAPARAQRDAATAALRLTTGQPDAVVAQAKAQQAQAEAGITQAQAGVEQARAAAAQAEAQVTQVRAQRSQAVAASESASLAVERLTLTAPFAGRVIGLGAEVGEAVGTGAAGATAAGSGSAGGSRAVLTLADLSGWRVTTTNLTELQVVGVRVGNRVQVEVDALPGRVFPGEVERVADASQVVRGDVTYVATVRLLTEGVAAADLAGLRPGMTAVVRDLVR